jgi:hypothetical protein
MALVRGRAVFEALRVVRLRPIFKENGAAGRFCQTLEIKVNRLYTAAMGAT